MSATECVAYGLIDEVLLKKEDAIKKWVKQKTSLTGLFAFYYE
jgi:hypothetical protein